MDIQEAIASASEKLKRARSKKDAVQEQYLIGIAGRLIPQTYVLGLIRMRKSEDDIVKEFKKHGRDVNIQTVRRWENATHQGITPKNLQVLKRVYKETLTKSS